MLQVILFALFTLLTFTPTTVTADPPPTGCEVVDHAGGYLCPPSDAQIKRWNERQESLPTIGELVEKYGNPSTCEYLFQPIECRDVERDVQVEDKLFMSRKVDGDLFDCEAGATVSDYVVWWEDLDCSLH